MYYSPGYILGTYDDSQGLSAPDETSYLIRASDFEASDGYGFGYGFGSW